MRLKEDLGVDVSQSRLDVLMDKMPSKYLVLSNTSELSTNDAQRILSSYHQFSFENIDSENDWVETSLFS